MIPRLRDDAGSVGELLIAKGVLPKTVERQVLKSLDTTEGENGEGRFGKMK